MIRMLAALFVGFFIQSVALAHGGDAHDLSAVSSLQMDRPADLELPHLRYWSVSVSSSSKFRTFRGSEWAGEEDIHRIPSRVIALTPTLVYRLRPTLALAGSAPVEFDDTTKSGDPSLSAIHTHGIGDRLRLNEVISLTGAVADESREHGKTVGVSSSIGGQYIFIPSWTLIPAVTGKAWAFRQRPPEDEAIAEFTVGTGLKYTSANIKSAFSGTLSFQHEILGDGSRRHSLAAVPLRSDLILKDFIASLFPEFKFSFDKRKIESIYIFATFTFMGEAPASGTPTVVSLR